MTRRAIFLDTHDAVRYLAGMTHAARRIKRYDNRKLYEPAERRYVTVADVGAMVAAGDDVHVEDQKSGQDLTSQVLAQFLLDQLKDRTASIPRQVLVALVRLSAGKGSAEWPEAHQAAGRVRAEAERIASGLLARGRLTLDEALGLRQEIAHSMQSALGETQRAIETRVRGLFERAPRADAVHPALETLGHKLEDLGTSIERGRGAPARRPRTKTTKAGPRARRDR
jgi:polyhydroxyalkanoate synthesis repressor PhaR